MALMYDVYHDRDSKLQERSKDGSQGFVINSV